jgi:hypothetical protein
MSEVQNLVKAVVVVVLAILAITTSSASAVTLPSILNIKSPQAVTGKSIGAAEWQVLTGLTLQCEESSMEASLATENTGTFHIVLGKCKSSSPAATCTGKDGTVNDASGTVLSLGTIKVVHDVTEAGSTYAILFELSPDTEFECTALAKIKLLGSWLCLITSPTVEKESHEFACGNNKTVGDPQETKYWFEMKEGTASLLSSLNGSSEETAAQVFLATLVTVGSPKAIVMN